MTYTETKLVHRIYVSNDPTITHAVYAYWRFWFADGTPIDFGASPQVRTFKQATKLVNKYYPSAEVLQRTTATLWESSKWGTEKLPA